MNEPKILSSITVGNLLRITSINAAVFKTLIIAPVVHVSQANAVDNANYEYKSSSSGCSFNHSLKHTSR